MDRIKKFEELKKLKDTLEKDVIRIQEKEKFIKEEISSIDKVLTENGIDLSNPEESLKKLEAQVDLELNAWENELKDLEGKVNKAKEAING